MFPTIEIGIETAIRSVVLLHVLDKSRKRQHNRQCSILLVEPEWAVFSKSRWTCPALWTKATTAKALKLL